MTGSSESRCTVAWPELPSLSVCGRHIGYAMTDREQRDP